MRDAVIPSISEYFTKVERGCDNMDDFIAKFMFDEATLFLNDKHSSGWDKLEKEQKIRKAQVNYLLLNDAHEQAYVLMADYHFNRSFPDDDWGFSRYNEEVEWFNQVVESIIIESQNNKELVIKLINLIKPISEKDIRKSKRDKVRDHFNKNDSRKKELMKKYKL